MREDVLRIGKIVEVTSCEGPGRRMAIFVQGCAIQCKNCCNPELFPFKGGTEYSSDDVVKMILESKIKNNIEGITWLGGEPASQSKAINYINKKLQENNLNVMMYSGYKKEKILEIYSHALDNVDILIDAPFEEDKVINHIRYVGSSNQTIYFLSNKFDNRKSEFDKPNSFEITFKDGKIHFVGWANSVLKLEKIMENK
jgi:anaerobic ribonucleoside-triphosphate reductase activating protein